MDVTVQGALVGAAAAIVGALLALFLQIRQDRIRARQIREDTISKEFTLAVQQLTISMAASVHSMCWLTWLANARGDRVHQANLDAYDAEQHRVLPLIIGYLSTVAALNVDIYRQLLPHTNKVFDLDAEIAEVGLSLDKDSATTVAKLAALNREVSEMERGLPLIVGNIVSKSIQEPIPVLSRTRFAAQ